MRLGKNMLRVRGFKGVLLLFLVLGTCSLVGCEKRESGSKDSEAAQREDVIAENAGGKDTQNAQTDTGSAQQRPEKGLLEVESWPGRRDMSTFSVTWLGGEETVVLRAFPRVESEEVARRGWDDGSEVEWTDSRVVVYATRPFYALRDTRMEVV